MTGAGRRFIGGNLPSTVPLKKRILLDFTVDLWKVIAMYADGYSHGKTHG